MRKFVALFLLVALTTVVFAHVFELKISSTPVPQADKDAPYYVNNPFFAVNRGSSLEVSFDKAGNKYAFDEASDFKFTFTPVAGFVTDVFTSEPVPINYYKYVNRLAHDSLNKLYVELKKDHPPVSPETDASSYWSRASKLAYSFKVDNAVASSQNVEGKNAFFVSKSLDNVPQSLVLGADGTLNRKADGFDAWPAGDYNLFAEFSAENGKELRSSYLSEEFRLRVISPGVGVFVVNKGELLPLNSEGNGLTINDVSGKTVGIKFSGTQAGLTPSTSDSKPALGKVWQQKISDKPTGLYLVISKIYPSKSGVELEKEQFLVVVASGDNIYGQLGLAKSISRATQRNSDAVACQVSKGDKSETYFNGKETVPVPKPKLECKGKAEDGYL